MITFSEFSKVRPLGQAAVDAISNYQEVVVKLDAAKKLATEAEATMTKVQTQLQAVSATALNAQVMATIHYIII